MAPTDVLRYQLANGLTVLLRATAGHAPVASLWVWYRVGSRVERRPLTGLTHWVEHMLFRGTDQFPGSSVHNMVARLGGVRNGMTSSDYTVYYETLPAGELDTALRIEADRMTNARFDPGDVEAERTVILSERAGRENSAAFRLREQVMAAAFPSHGYGHPVIGYRDDLQRITRDELWQHYRQNYGPDNAVVVVAGSFDREALIARIDELFGQIQPRRRTVGRPESPADSQSEPFRGQAATVRLSGPEPTAYVQLLFPAVRALDDDYFPLLVLDSILGGAASMGNTGRGAGFRTSRLYRSVVQTELAASAGSSMRPTADPYLFVVSASVRQGVAPERVQDALWAEVETARAAAPTETELQRAQKQTRAQFIFGSERASSQGYWLGFSEIVADLPWLLEFPDRVAAVTSDEVQRVANQYLRRETAIVGLYVPDDAPSAPA
ncbi:MAG: pitrilysin family protein [Caldilineales bacterium]